MRRQTKILSEIVRLRAMPKTCKGAVAPFSWQVPEQTERHPAYLVTTPQEHTSACTTSFPRLSSPALLNFLTQESFHTPKLADPFAAVQWHSASLVVVASSTTIVALRVLLLGNVGNRFCDLLDSRGSRVCSYQLRKLQEVREEVVVEGGCQMVAKATDRPFSDDNGLGNEPDKGDLGRDNHTEQQVSGQWFSGFD